jgi:hypothetical protein
MRSRATPRFSSLAIGGCLRALLSTVGCYFPFYSRKTCSYAILLRFPSASGAKTANFFCGVKSRPTLFTPTPAQINNAGQT